MQDHKDFEPPPRIVRMETKQARQDEFKKIQRLLRWAVAAIFPAALALIAAVGLIVYAVKMERVTVWAVDRDKVSFERAIRLDGAPLPNAGLLETIQYWITDLRWITADPVYNDLIRGRAVTRLHVKSDDKNTIIEQLRASLPPQTPQQTIVSQIVDIEITPVSVQQVADTTDEKESPKTLRQWRAEWVEETQDLSVSADKMDIQRKRYVADIITHEGNPQFNNFTGVLFEPMSVREVPNESR